ncbi:MAG: glycoside hydrolase, family 9 [Gammaproteobacteria bacterium]|nr:glycoside hydrolase, family 9 [Gammaproteobacteria bacterium]
MSVRSANLCNVMEVAVKLRYAALSALWLMLADCNSGAAVPKDRIAHVPEKAKAIRFDAHLLVDQFGYRPEDPKVAVIRDPRKGYDAADEFSPGTAYEVRSAADGRAVFAAAPQPWHGGTVEPSSGDRGWWLDFSTVNTPGTYFIVDVNRNVRSATFKIDQDVYKNVLRAALRMYYYQRSGFAKQRPYADQCWVDSPAYLGSGQDLEARDVTDRGNEAKVRDLSGGWFDAGDTNKYVTFAAQAVHQLLTAYQESPAAFTDDFNVPESGNGVPDILDEIKWETDWLKKMQFPDGSSALKVGEIVYAAAAPPSSDRNARYYVPSCSSSTIAAAGMFAHAAYVFGQVPALAGESAMLKARAIAAWNNYASVTAKQTHCDTGVVHAGIADLSEDDQRAAAALAAVYIFAITADAHYEHYLQQHFRELQPYHDVGWSRYHPEQGEALLFYTTLANADPALKRAVIEDKRTDVRQSDQTYGFNADDDLYRSFMPEAQYHWGSNNPRAGYGNTNLDVLTYGIGTQAGAGTYRTRALEVLHYFHGVNPFAMVYLSNMYAYGATRSANEIYHGWFADSTRWSDALASECGPAPGFVPGGPNSQAAQNGVPQGLMPPVGQPPQKSYRDWNKASPDSSWAVTEPAVYYQSGYVKLLAHFVK